MKLTTITDSICVFSLHSYYPLYPPVEEVNMDYEKYQSFGQMPLTPDVLIIPSELRYFVKVQTSCFCIMMGGFFLDYVHIVFHSFMTSR